MLNQIYSAVAMETKSKQLFLPSDVRSSAGNEIFTDRSLSSKYGLQHIKVEFIFLINN